jgi:8-oxo-dGTP pyrophosphatase MutT (NUDIX family)
MARRKQYAALPWRLEDGAPRVLLVTSRDTGRWVLPKGWPMKKRPPHDAAQVEAFEEAGAIGRAEKRPVGAFVYRKRLKDGSTALCTVSVFPMPVERLEADWPEAHERRRAWFAPEEAAGLVAEPDLADLLRRFAA